MFILSVSTIKTMRWDCRFLLAVIDAYKVLQETVSHFHNLLIVVT
jgi:hypothetical protein